jgi:enoyl reductase
VKAAGVQPFDCTVRSGALAQWMPVALPSRLGNEFAGVVDEVGPDVTRFAIGDEVLGFESMACYAELVVVSASQIVTKPAQMPWLEAGVLSASGQTAHTAIEQINVGPSDTLLVHAAAGGVGTFAVQIARARGASVIGTASEANHSYLRGLGVIPVVYGPGLEERVRAAAPQGVTAVLDCIGGDALSVSTRLVAERHRIGTVTDRINGSKLGVQVIGTDRSAARLADLLSIYQDGGLKIFIWKSFPLVRAADAHHEVETGHVRGKVALTTG